MISKEDLYVLQAGECCYCEQPMLIIGDMSLARFASLYGLTRKRAAQRQATYEHLTRKTDGGNNRRENLAVACKWCNSKRHDLSWVEHKGLMMCVRREH